MSGGPPGTRVQPPQTRRRQHSGTATENNGVPHILRGVTEAVACANCAVTIREDYAEVAGWSYRSERVGELHLLREICFLVELAPDAPASARRIE